jgi:hypothetical protein
MSDYRDSTTGVQGFFYVSRKEIGNFLFLQDWGPGRQLTPHAGNVVWLQIFRYSVANTGTSDVQLPLRTGGMMKTADIASMITNQKNFYAAGRTRDIAFRKQMLGGLKMAIETNQKAILDALYADLKKPAHEAYVSEIYLVKRKSISP